MTPERDRRVKLVRLTGTGVETKRAPLADEATAFTAFSSPATGGCNVFAAFLRIHQMARGSDMDDQGPKAGNQRGADGFGSLLEAVFEGVFEVDGEFAFLVAAYACSSWPSSSYPALYTDWQAGAGGFSALALVTR